MKYIVWTSDITWEVCDAKTKFELCIAYFVFLHVLARADGADIYFFCFAAGFGNVERLGEFPFPSLPSLVLLFLCFFLLYIGDSSPFPLHSLRSQ